VSNHYDNGESSTDEDRILEDVNPQELLQLQAQIETIDRQPNAVKRLGMAEKWSEALNG
jgi:hypothetical protein